jgi:hypothetical protein
VWAPSPWLGILGFSPEYYPLHFYIPGYVLIFALSLKHTTMPKKHEHGYLPKIQYHSLKVIESTNTLMEPNLPEEFKAGELAALNKSLDSIIYFTTKLREQWTLK